MFNGFEWNFRGFRLHFECYLKDFQGILMAVRLFLQAQLMQAKGSTEEALQRLSLAAVALVESRDRHGEALAWQLSAKIHLEKRFASLDKEIKRLRHIYTYNIYIYILCILFKLSFNLKVSSLI